MGQGCFHFNSSDGADLFCTDAPQAVNNHFILLKSHNGRFQSYGAVATIKDIRDFSLKTLQHVRRRNRTHITRGICTGCSKWKIKHFQQRQCHGVCGNPDGHPCTSGSNHVWHQRRFGQKIRDGARRQQLHQAFTNIRHTHYQPFSLLKVCHMKNQRIELRTILGIVYPGDGGYIEPIGCKSINSFRGNCHQLSPFEERFCLIKFFAYGCMVHKKIPAEAGTKLMRIQFIRLLISLSCREAMA